MRALAALLLALLALPPAAAQPASPAGALSAEVELSHTADDVLHVNLTATAPAAVLLPTGENVTLAAGERTSYSVRIERPSSTVALAPRSAVLPAGIGTLRIFAPTGWDGFASEGIVLFARDLHVEERAAGISRVRSASPVPLTAAEVALLSRGVAYLAAQHSAAPHDITLVRVPADVAPAPFVVDDSIVISTDESAEGLAGALVRFHQRYRVVEVAPTSASWLREGEERVQTQMALLAAGLRTAAQVEETFTLARAVADPDDRLTQSPAGSTISRQKGVVVVRALDHELRNASGGRVGLADLFARLDAIPGRLDSASVQEQAEALAGPRLSAFFERYVYGPAWPTTPTVRDSADVFVRSLVLHPARAAPGEQVVLAYELENRGTQPSELDLVVSVDDATLRTIPVRLAVGARGAGTSTLALVVPGLHRVALGSYETELQVLTPGALALARATSTPAMPRAGQPFTLLVYVENRGETAASTRVEIYEGDTLVQRTTTATVDGGATDALTLPMRFDEPGARALDIRLVGASSDALAHEVVVEPGLPRNETPLPAWALLAPLAVIGLLRARRR